MKIVVAVSGGVDSVVLLHQLVEKYEAKELVVGHVDHGYRTDSAADARFVEGLAHQYGCQFVSIQLKLTEPSEAEARTHRWGFLRNIAREYEASKIATAHHRDDIYETMLLNTARGTGRHGLTSLRETEEIMRPLLSWSKEEIYEYALEYRLEWVEDPTNYQDDYMRNKLRHSGILQSPEVRSRLDDIYKKLMYINAELDATLVAVVDTFTRETERRERCVDRSVYNQFSFKTQLEIARHLLANSTGHPPRDSLQVERCALGIKVALPGTQTKLDDVVKMHHAKQWSYVEST